MFKSDTIIYINFFQPVMRMLAIVFFVALVAVAGLIINLTETTTAQITRPHSPSCAWIHPDAISCKTLEFGCPGPEGKFKAKAFNFRQEKEICCCIPQW